jgi:ferredoxin
MISPSIHKTQKHRWLKPSTRAFLKEARQTPGFTTFDTLHGYIYLRWAYTYIGIALGEHWINRVVNFLQGFLLSRTESQSRIDNPDKSVADVYHGKVLKTDAARQLVSVREDVDLRDLEQVIPYPHARDIVLRNPDHLVVIDCPCRSAREKPCLPLDVCLIVGEPFASFIAEHHPDKTRWIDAEEACDILEREHQRGRVHQAFFKDATRGRFYVICNCCSCCCGAMQARRSGIPLVSASGYSCQIDPSACIGCGDCIDSCRFSAIEWIEDALTVAQDRCMGCGICSTVCETGAITVMRDLSKSDPLEITDLISGQLGRSNRHKLREAQRS